LGLSFTEQDMNQRYMERSTELFPDLFAIKANNEANQNRIYNTVVFRIRVRHQIEGYLIFRASDHEGIKFYELSLLNDLREHIISAFIKAKLLFDQKRINDELIRLNNTKNEFLGIAAHDLRNPLTAIIGYIDLILDDLNAEKFNTGLIKKDLNTVLMSAQQMVKLITNLLDISAIESGKINLDLKYQNINRVFEECEKLNHNTAQHKNIQLQIEKNPELPDTFFDMSRMIEAVDNLISNAVKYTHAGGTVRLYSQLTDNTIVTHIQDTGLGMNDDDLKDMFTSFKKLSARPTGGESSTGLGLAIVKKIVVIHGGEIWVKSRKGEGSTFSFSLPVTHELTH
jgi:two-component system, sensor histidine kinase and response regulator